MEISEKPLPGPVLTFWFAPDAEERWFAKDTAFDETIRDRFGALHERAAGGELTTWEETADGALALLILLDQFPRNMFRDSPRAFASDAAARRTAEEALARSHDRMVDTRRRRFFYLPFMHSEHLADQERCVALFRERLPDDTEGLKYAILHRDIVARFGRFPHRNAILGRDTTPAEAAFLKEPDSSF